MSPDSSQETNLFLPQLTPEANKLLRDHYSPEFIRGQLQHYGVDYNEKEFSGNGTLLFKKVLQASKVRHLVFVIIFSRSSIANMHHSVR